MKPARIVLVLFLGWLALQFFPALGRGWPGFIGGCITVWLIYVLLRHTPENSRGGTPRTQQGPHMAPLHDTQHLSTSTGCREAESHLQAQIATMVDNLRPHSGSLDSLWEAMPGAFLAAFGREVDKADSYDLALCHAALCAFDI
jgi:hypothetical protein